MAIIEESSSRLEIQQIETASDQTSQRNVGWIEGQPMAIIEESSSRPEIQQIESIVTFQIPDKALDFGLLGGLLIQLSSHALNPTYGLFAKMVNIYSLL